MWIVLILPLSTSNIHPTIYFSRYIHIYKHYVVHICLMRSNRFWVNSFTLHIHFDVNKDLTLTVYPGRYYLLSRMIYRRFHVAFHFFFRYWATCLISPGCNMTPMYIHNMLTVLMKYAKFKFYRFMSHSRFCFHLWKDVTSFSEMSHVLTCMIFVIVLTTTVTLLRSNPKDQ